MLRWLGNISFSTILKKCLAVPGVLASMSSMERLIRIRSRSLTYHYVTRENYTWWWAPSWETHCYLSFFIVNMDSNFQELTIAEEGFFSKIAQAIGFDDIDFESHEFSRRYKVKSQSKKFAYDFCNARMIDYLLDQPITTIEVENHALALAFDDPHEAGMIDSRLRHVTKMRSLMPDYVFDGVFDAPEHVDQQSNSRSAKKMTSRSAKGVGSYLNTLLTIVGIGAIIFVLAWVGFVLNAVGDIFGKL